MESLKSLCTLSANESIFGLTQVGQLGDIRRDASGQIGVANTQVRCSINRLNQSEMRSSVSSTRPDELTHLDQVDNVRKNRPDEAVKRKRH